jgi:hypothetical protein
VISEVLQTMKNERKMQEKYQRKIMEVEEK